MFKTIIRSCEGREKFAEYLMGKLAPLVPYIIVDDTGNAMNCFRQALDIAKDSPALHMEDDIILTEGFCEKVKTEIEKHPDQVIQFFSIRKKDLTEGTRLESGGKFLMGQCFYLPAGLSMAIKAYLPSWKGIKEHPTGLDSMVMDYLKVTKRKYIHFVPSLVQHREVKSMIDPRRSSKRQSPTFINPDL
jgi:hypothetical protein